MKTSLKVEHQHEATATVIPEAVSTRRAQQCRRERRCRQGPRIFHRQRPSRPPGTLAPRGTLPFLPSAPWVWGALFSCPCHFSTIFKPICHPGLGHTTLRPGHRPGHPGPEEALPWRWDCPQRGHSGCGRGGAETKSLRKDARGPSTAAADTLLPQRFPEDGLRSRGTSSSGRRGL